MTYTNWAPGEPNFGSAEACMHLVTFYQPYKWNNWSCSGMTCFICEMDMSG